ncbi:hypothetical protein [Shewanella surugensis]|uniref:DUF3014 domain-containing protein n=1 Tax=Shewanella surugensis TaxID=212020 RepID=A0ABT0LFN5_9GAMM|nr:hypothetical protein [Shewanella surugensis]MCL1126511.1 hypothetical protein [Shewanella surugensis]
MRLKFFALRLILLVGVLLFIVFEHWQLHREGALPNRVKTNQIKSNQAKPADVWLQPEEALRFFPTQIGEQDYHFNYARFAPIIARVKRDINQLLVIDEHTKDQLKRLTQGLPPDLLPIDRQRLDFLIQKNIPGKAGGQFINLLHAYGRYTRLLDVHLKHVNLAEPSYKPQHLSDSVAVVKQLQLAVFGQDLAALFFTRDNIRMNYLTQRRLLMLDNSMSVADKQAIRERLQLGYRLGLAELEALDELKELAQLGESGDG